MLIDSSDLYKNDLFSLWKEAFSDEDHYIDLFFETAYKNCVKAFAEFDKDKIVSALYLMPSYIIDDDISYKGYYLYAAATLKSHRGKGIMGKLINEAKDYAIKMNKMFISLVPGEEYLYSYYKKFGFEAIMYRNKEVIQAYGKSDNINDYRIKLDRYFQNRKDMITVSAHHLSDEVYGYAVKCYEYLVVEAFKVGNSSFIYDNENKCIKELLTVKANVLTECLRDGMYTFYSPFGKNKEKFGMVWFADDSVKINEIYMNIALD